MDTTCAAKALVTSRLSLCRKSISSNRLPFVQISETKYKFLLSLQVLTSSIMKGWPLNSFIMFFSRKMCSSSPFFSIYSMLTSLIAIIRYVARSVANTTRPNYPRRPSWPRRQGLAEVPLCGPPFALAQAGTGSPADPRLTHVRQS